MINCLEAASCQLACDLCSLCSNHLLRTYEAASPFLSPFPTYYCWERTGPGLQGSHAKIGTPAPSSLTVKEIYRLILSSLLQFSRIVPAMSRAPGLKQNRKCSHVPWDSNCWAVTCQMRRFWESKGFSEQLLCFLLRFLDLKQVIGILISFYKGKKMNGKPAVCVVAVFCSPGSEPGAGQLSSCCSARLTLVIYPQGTATHCSKRWEEFL